VLGRFAEVVALEHPDTIVRLTADCPLADPSVLDHVIRTHLAGGTDYTSNTIPPTYPDGLDVEVVRADAFARLLTLPLNAIEREHVTYGIYTRPDQFTLTSVVQAPDRSDLRWTVDIPGDLEFVRTVYARLYPGNPRFGQAEILELLAAEPTLNRTESEMARNQGLLDQL
jgi:spore coat polysaccharide biosynthesis protein SpsF